MGSGSDRPIMEKAGQMLDRFGIESVTQVLSAHKTPDQAIAFAEGAAAAGFQVIIAGAGKAAHLAGVMAAKSLLPVIGVPLSASLDGLDALLSTVQMPTGIPVATVAVDGSTNAALLAVAILAIDNAELRESCRAIEASSRRTLSRARSSASAAAKPPLGSTTTSSSDSQSAIVRSSSLMRRASFFGSRPLSI